MKIYFQAFLGFSAILHDSEQYTYCPIYVTIFYGAGEDEPFCVTCSEHSDAPGSNVTFIYPAGSRKRRMMSMPIVDSARVLSFSQQTSFPRNRGALKFVWTKEVLDENLGCRPLKIFVDSISDMQMPFWIWLLIKFSWTSAFLCWKACEISHLPDPSKNCLISVSLSAFSICLKLSLSSLCTIYIKMFSLSPVTNSVWVNIKTIPLTSKRSKRMQEKSKEKTMSVR